MSAGQRDNLGLPAGSGSCGWPAVDMNVVASRQKE